MCELVQVSVTSYHLDMETIEVENCTRGHYVFRTVWSSTVREQLNCIWESSNTQDSYIVAVMTSITVEKISLRGLSFLKCWYSAIIIPGLTYERY